MSDARQQLNEMKSFLEIMEGEGDRPYVCHHNKKGEHECKAGSSYAAAKKAADHWGLDSTAGVSATLTDVKQSTQFVGEEEEKNTPEPKFANDKERYDYYKAELAKLADGAEDVDEAGDPDDTDWDAHWAREDGDEERADDLEADAEFARMDSELDKDYELKYDAQLEVYVVIFGNHVVATGTDDYDEAVYQADDIYDNRFDLEEVGDTSFDDYGATPVYENDAECDKCYGLGRKPSGGADCEECGGSGKCPKLDEISLESIVESVLDGQPRDYEMSDDELSDPDNFGPAARSKSSIIKDRGDELGVDVIDMPMSDFEDDFIDPEIEDEELGLRFD